MRIFLPLLLLEAFINVVFNEQINRETFAVVYILINSLALIGWFVKKSKNKTIFMILTFGLLIRLAALWYDQSVALLPFNTGDSYKFHELAVETAEALPDVLLEHFTGFYSQVLGVVYYFFGPYRFFGQYLNVAFVVLAATKLIDIAELLKIKDKNTILMIFLWLFMPIPFLMGYALIREGSMYYLIVLGVYHFLKWFEKYNPIYIVLTILPIYIASLYHEGALYILPAMIYAFLFYDKKKEKINFNFINIMFLIVAVIGAIIIVTQNADSFIDKTNAETGGGSTYLAALEINNPIEFIMYAPIKGFYLLYSPMPWLIRGGLDILTFVFDTCLWGYATYNILRNFRKIDTKYKMLFLAIFVAGMVYGMGTHNTGTAMRHRNKFMSLMLISYIGVKDKYIDSKKEQEKVGGELVC
ncbi:MAG: hypothetical protein E7F58_04040 [Clostridium saudiense]|uniref:hypothetical protein n=1 Tax=Clostridium saudiense TaxID=1414720 RepID=UPI00290B7621|nr:hypothetical protein [Clostridium saudiense]MDU3520818.1 hypothetical protein [Clostridium saudiense]